MKATTDVAGFFTKYMPTDGGSVGLSKRKHQEKTFDCDRCGLHREVRSPKIPVAGRGRLGVLLLGEGPGGTEDELNRAFVGESGELLARHLKAAGFDLDRDFWRRNVVNCRPTRKGSGGGLVNRAPTLVEIRCCRPVWEETVRDLRPKAVILFGGEAVRAWWMDRGQKVREDLSIGRWRRLWVSDLRRGTWVTALYHPSYALRQSRGDKGGSPEEDFFSLDLKRTLGELPVPPLPERREWKSEVRCLTDFNQVIKEIKAVQGLKSTVAHDYETTGRRPFVDGHKVVSVGVSSVRGTFSFPFWHPKGGWTAEERELIAVEWRKYLLSPVPKAAHSVQMEELWGRAEFGVETAGWVWDTMVNAHVLDVRPKTTSLDFQVFLHWGHEYGEDVAPFKTEVPGTPFNRIMEAPLARLLEYNGQDALFTRLLADVQRSGFKRVPERNAGRWLFREGIATFCDMTWTGIDVDEGYRADAERKLTRRIKVVEARLMASPEAAAFKGAKGREVNIRSNSKDLNELFFDILKFPPVKLTAKDNNSLDQEVLHSLDSDFARMIVRHRHLTKIRDTYLKAFGDTVDGKIHPDFNLHMARSLRSSSSGPNFQNIPKRDEEAQEICRRAVVAPPGYRMAGSDYGGHEVRIIACLSRDEVLVREINGNPEGFDPHQEWADYLGIKRFDAKNGFVFPLFYGSYHANVHRALTDLGYGVSEQRVKRAEEEFWRRYRGVRRWQEEMLAFYRRNGYVYMPWGFVREGRLERNKIFNTPVQGAAFHCLLWSANRCNRARRTEGWKTKIPGQIHDEINWYLWPDEESHVVETATRVMTEDIRRENPWIIVPLLAEWKIGEVGESWFEVGKPPF